MFKLLLIFLSLVALSSSATSDDSVRRDNILAHGDEPLGGDFVLHSSQGRFSIAQQRGKVVLLYFGYTKCPDVCPTSLATMAQALNELSEDELKTVQGVFVSVDPKRDSYAVLDDYVGYFHPSLLGVTGSKSEIDLAAKLYGVEFEEVEQEVSGFGYVIDHSAATYIITPEGELRFMFPHQTPSFVILEAIRYLLANRQ
jgi:protein SCO1/2